MRQETARQPKAVLSRFAPDLDRFESGQSFATWLGLVPRP
ncbi:transposase [Roseovarius gahaiensis]